VRQALLPFTVIKLALFDWWRDWVNMAALNLVWVLCWVTVVLGPPFTFAVYSIANEFVHGRSMDWRELPGMLRRYLLTSWAWMFLNVLMALGLWANFHFYAQLGTAWSVWLQYLSVLVAIFWLVMQFYTLPYLMEQDRPRLGQAYKNAALTALASPFYTLVVAGLAALVMVVSIRLVVLLFLGGPCFVAVLGAHAVLERLTTYRIRERGTGTLS
jgi:hypothetical protein